MDGSAKVGSAKVGSAKVGADPQCASAETSRRLFFRVVIVIDSLRGRGQREHDNGTDNDNDNDNELSLSAPRGHHP